jgi:hypothetical protein
MGRRAPRDEPLEKRRGWRLAIAAPRGNAKTTIKSLLFPLHAIYHGREKYIVILSATLKQARQRLVTIRSEIAANPLLIQNYPELYRGEKKLTDRRLIFNDTLVEVYSAGMEIRGISHRQWRPTLVILDDVEDSRSAHSPERRERLWEWYNEVIENIGDGYTGVEIVGTLLHPDSLLARLLRRPDFEGRVFRGVERFAARQDLWDQWKSLYVNLDDPGRDATARAFFEERRTEMLEGSRVLWEAKEDYYDLMRQLVNKGRTAFFKEKQNEPGNPENAFFDLGRLVKFRLRDDVIEIEG